MCNMHNLAFLRLGTIHFINGVITTLSNSKEGVVGGGVCAQSFHPLKERAQEVVKGGAKSLVVINQRYSGERGGG